MLIVTSGHYSESPHYQLGFMQKALQNVRQKLDAIEQNKQNEHFCMTLMNECRSEIDQALQVAGVKEMAKV